MSTSIADFEDIRKAVNKYEEGINKGDITLLRSVFHPKAMMYGSSGEDTTIVEIEGLFSYVSSKESPATTGEQQRCTLTKIDIAGNAASVEVLQENCYGSNYTNYFQLLKVEGQWLIMSKAYNVDAVKQTIQEEVSLAREVSF